IEIRAKIPEHKGNGIWPALWMLGYDIQTVGWPACGEIDIMEMIGGTGDNTAYGAAHWDNNGSHAFYTGYTTLPSGVFADAFHTFTIEWNSSYIRWLMDGQQYHIIDITPQQLSEFHQDFFILLNVAVGGNWPGPPDGTTVFPQTMEVDYVRIYHDLNQMPSVSITSPEAGQDFTSGSSITITAEASDNDGTVEIVQFFQNSGLLGENDSEPYQITLSNIQPGNYSIQARVIDNDGLANFSDQVDFTVDGGNDHAPYLISPQNIPGIVEAENYDIGGEGVAYHDQDPENQGYFYRSGEGVDIEQLESGDGMNVGWIDDGEWLEYTLYVENSGEYLLETSVASQDGGGYYYIQMDEQTIVGYTAVTSTGGWQNWTTISHNVSLSEGIHVLRFTAFYGGFNFDKITTTVITGINDGNSILPNHFSLKQNYPNPFNPKTTITYQLPNKEVVLLEVYNSMG
ncbi:MAG: family 16 glycosylhydrolase, partial [Calditrichia bacterium]|nr:family 16 glycosylhydrolase [Calditrichia bacterium]